MLVLLPFAAAQHAGSIKTERHPPLVVQSCTKAGGCIAKTQSVVLDANWRWVHNVNNYTNCFDGNHWNKAYCPDPETCAASCALEGNDEEYETIYGVKSKGTELKLGYVVREPDGKVGNVGSRTYLLDTDQKYAMFKLKNREFAFDVDASRLPCGLNGALYFVQMDADGGMDRFPGNKAGAKYGTGYCDAQCPHDLKFISGEANILDWDPIPNSSSGFGKYGSCCTEMDIWESNAMSTAFTAHSCALSAASRCDGVECGDGDARFRGVCDKNGCDLNTFRLGNTSFYGRGSEFAVDTTKPITVITQFITEDGTDTGKLTEVRRHYKQGGNMVLTPELLVGGAGPFSSLSDKYCDAEVKLFKDRTNFLDKGGMNGMDKAFEKGMVLTMSIWDDGAAHMLWLDSNYPVNSTAPGAARGSCPVTSGSPGALRNSSGAAFVTYSNIKFGEIGSTSLPPRQAVAVSASSDQFRHSEECVNRIWMQCAGIGYSGQTCCPVGTTCTLRSDAFSQCTPGVNLLQAFFHTAPSMTMMQAFLANGTTLFHASGVPSQPYKKP